MQERRKHPRKKPDELLEVIDINTDNHLGNIVDVSLGGILLITRHDIEVNSVFQMVIKLPASYSDCTDIEFGGEVLWTELCSDTIQRWIGFQIIDISANAKTQISQLVDRLQ